MLRTYTRLTRTIFFHCFYFFLNPENLNYHTVCSTWRMQVKFCSFNTCIVLVQFVNIKTIIIILSCRHTVSLYVRFPILKFKNTRKHISRLKLPSKWERSRLNSKMGVLIKNRVWQEEKHCLLLFFFFFSRMPSYDISYSVLKGFN